jgi:hypothetical protein
MSFTAFLLAALVLAITPGPGIAYVVARIGYNDDRARRLASFDTTSYLTNENKRTNHRAIGALNARTKP